MSALYLDLPSWCAVQLGQETLEMKILGLGLIAAPFIIVFAVGGEAPAFAAQEAAINTASATVSSATIVQQSETKKKKKKDSRGSDTDRRGS